MILKASMTEAFESFEAKRLVPLEREVYNQFDFILEGRSFTEINRVEDENGLLVLDIVSTDAVGDRLDISYQRMRNFQSGAVGLSRITQTLYLGDTPCSAGTQYNYVDGEWIEHGCIN
jgi:hypothetical protein